MNTKFILYSGKQMSLLPQSNEKRPESNKPLLKNSFEFLA